VQIQASAARLDDFDARDLKEMLASRPFALLRARLAAELERQRAACERAAEAVELHRAQGAVAALRTALDLPERVLKEIAAKV
jgi:hypothetical protein